MTPDPRAVEAMEKATAEALWQVEARYREVLPDVTAADSRWEVAAQRIAPAILAALPEGWTLIGPEQQAALAKGEAVVVLEALAPIVTISGAWRNWKGEPYWRATGGTARRPRRAYDVTGPTLAEAAAQAAKQERARLRGEVWDTIKRPDAGVPVRTMDDLLDAPAEPTP